MNALRQFEVVTNDLPDPPYPADVRARGWRFDLDIERIENSDTWTLTPPDMRPWLLMLWMRSWTQTPCGSLPASDELVAARIGMDARLFAANRDILMRGWRRCSDGRLYHPVITESVEAMRDSRKAERIKKANQRAKDGPAAAAAAPAPSDENVPGDSTGNPEGVPLVSQGCPPTGPGPGTGPGTGKRQSAKNRPTASPDGSLFDEFWTHYPKKAAKKDARKAFDKTKADRTKLDAMIAALKVQKASEAWKKDNGQFIPNGATWLNGERWTDEQGVDLRSSGANADYERTQQYLRGEAERSRSLQVDPERIRAARAASEAARLRRLGVASGPAPIASLFPGQDEKA